MTLISMTRLPTYSPGILQTVHHFLLIISLCLTGIIGSRYSRMGQVKFVEGSHYKILPITFLNTLTQLVLS